ncbi:MAG: hypothetical protein K2M55_05535 [Muribaculaceae bacterium]|nr:hypothetical protein [Muribaculaceae bacterium]
MINAITQETLYLILPSKVSQLAVLYAKKFGVTAMEALRTIYCSNTYRALEDESTKLWHLGPVALLEYISEYH